MKKSATPITPSVLRFRRFWILFGFFAVAVLFSAYFLIFCRVQTISVENTAIITEQAVLDAVDIQAARHLYAVSEAKIERAVMKGSPYVRSVTIKRDLPSTLRILVEEYDLAYYIEYEKRYYLITDEFLILEETTPEEAAAKGAVLLKLPKLKDPEPPEDDPDAPKVLTPMETLVFAVKADKAWSLSLLSAIRETAVSESITAIDISDPFDLHLQIADKYTILLGNERDFAKKLSRAKRALEYLSESAYGLTGILHVQKDAPVTFEFTGVIENVDS